MHPFLKNAKMKELEKYLQFLKTFFTRICIEPLIFHLAPENSAMSVFQSTTMFTCAVLGGKLYDNDKYHIFLSHCM
jgi:hypothetical protein